MIKVDEPHLASPTTTLAWDHVGRMALLLEPFDERLADIKSLGGVAAIPKSEL